MLLGHLPDAVPSILARLISGTIPMLARVRGAALVIPALARSRLLDKVFAVGATAVALAVIAADLHQSVHEVSEPILTQLAL